MVHGGWSMLFNIASSPNLYCCVSSFYQYFKVSLVTSPPLLLLYAYGLVQPVVQMHQSF